MGTQANKPQQAVSPQVARWIAAAGANGETDMYAGKRHAKRVSDELYLEVTTDPQKASATWGVYMHNVSGGGVAFWSKQGVILRSAIFIRDCDESGPGPWLRARVTHCTRGLRGFLVGAAFENQ